MKEFTIIERFFKRPFSELQSNATHAHVVCGIGDDAAVLTAPEGQQWVMSMDTLVEGVHFLPGTSADHIGYKSLAVNLSDLAAMGAKPAWVLLALTLPESVDESWLQAFSEGFFELIHRYQLALIGGDTTQGPLSITCQVTGFVPAPHDPHQPQLSSAAPQTSRALLRSGAQPGDAIFVIGYLGGAGLALNMLTQEGVQPSRPLTQEEKNTLLCCLHRPSPQIEAGWVLRDLATAVIDVSDGLLADLGHIASCSRVGAHIFQDLLPVHPIVKQVLPWSAAVELGATAGDDYALCCTVPQAKRHQLLSAFHHLKVPCRYVGTVTENLEVGIYNARAERIQFAQSGYQHGTSSFKKASL